MEAATLKCSWKVGNMFEKICQLVHFLVIQKMNSLIDIF